MEGLDKKEEPNTREDLTSVDKVIAEVRKLAMEKVYVPANVFGSENKETREKTAEEYIHINWKMAQDISYTTPVITVDQALEAIRLSKIEALEESHNKISALSSLAHISDAQAILYKQITQLKNGK